MDPDPPYPDPNWPPSGSSGSGSGSVKNEYGSETLPWGHQTQSLPGSRCRSFVGTSDLKLGEADIGYFLGTSDTVFAWLQVKVLPWDSGLGIEEADIGYPGDIRHSLCLATGIQ